MNKNIMNKNTMSRDINQGTKTINKKLLKEYCSTDCVGIIISYLFLDVKIGDVVNAYCAQGQQWYVCLILNYINHRVLIHYVGWRNEWDEWLSIDKITPFNDICNTRVGRPLRKWQNFLEMYLLNGNVIIFIRAGISIIPGKLRKDNKIEYMYKQLKYTTPIPRHCFPLTMPSEITVAIENFPGELV